MFSFGGPFQVRASKAEFVVMVGPEKSIYSAAR